MPRNRRAARGDGGRGRTSRPGPLRLTTERDVARGLVEARHRDRLPVRREQWNGYNLNLRAIETPFVDLRTSRHWTFAHLRIRARRFQRLIRAHGALQIQRVICTA